MTQAPAASESGVTVDLGIEFQREHRGRKRAGPPPAVPPIPVEPGNIPRVAKLLALAHRFDRLVREGVVRDYADLARLGGVSRARITQITHLLLLAPEIQEEILVLPRSVEGKDPITEKGLREIVRQPAWTAQNAAWTRLTGSVPERVHSALASGWL